MDALISMFHCWVQIQMAMAKQVRVFLLDFSKEFYRINHKKDVIHPHKKDVITWH